MGESTTGLVMITMYTILVVIIMLNLLISIVDKVYEDTMAHRQTEFVKAKAQIINVCMYVRQGMPWLVMLLVLAACHPREATLLPAKWLLCLASISSHLSLAMVLRDQPVCLYLCPLSPPFGWTGNGADLLHRGIRPELLP